MQTFNHSRTTLVDTVNFYQAEIHSWWLFITK